EDCGRGADAERQTQDRDRGEAGTPPQRANGETNVLADPFEPRAPGRSIDRWKRGIHTLQRCRDIFLGSETAQRRTEGVGGRAGVLEVRLKLAPQLGALVFAGDAGRGDEPVDERRDLVAFTHPRRRGSRAWLR